MTWEEYCAKLFPPGGPEGPEHMDYTLCMHDPTSDAAVGAEVPRSDF